MLLESTEILRHLGALHDKLAATAAELGHPTFAEGTLRGLEFATELIKRLSGDESAQDPV